MNKRTSYRFPWGKYPGVRIAILLAIGIALADYIDPAPGFLLVLTATAAGLWGLSECMAVGSLNRSVSGASLLAYLVLIPLLGAYHYTADREQLRHEKTEAERLSLFEWEEITLKGRVSSRTRSSSGRLNYDLDVGLTVIDTLDWRQNYTIRLYGPEYTDQETSSRLYEPGDLISVTVRLYTLEAPRNPIGFDYRAFLYDQGIFLHGEILDGEVLDRPRRTAGWQVFRNAVHERLEKLFDDETVSLAKALLTGYRQELDGEERQQFARAGISHIMAVSGLHVGFIAAPFWMIIPWLWRWKYGGWAGLALLTVVLILFAGLAEFSPSVSRASLMAWLLSAGKMLRRMMESLNLMGVSAIILLVIDPSRLFEIGFQLSYCAVFVILLLLPGVQKLMPDRIQYSWKGSLLTVVLLSVIVQLGLYPLLVWYFGEFSVIGPVTNALVVPLLSAVVPFSFLLVSTAGTFPELSATLNLPNHYALSWIGFLANYLGGWDGSWFQAELQSPLIFLVWLSLIAFLAAIQFPSLRVRFGIVLLTLLTLLPLKSLITSIHPATMNVTVLDVGQGDAIHLSTPNGRQILIDTGRWTPWGNSGDRVLLPYFESKGIDKLDAVILSHPHADHIGGLPALMRNVEIDSIYHSGYRYDSEIYREYNRLVTRKGVGMRAVMKGDQIGADPSLRIFVLGPDGGYHNSNPNDHSVVVKVVYNRVHFLFTGDAEHHQEQRISEVYGRFLDADFLKAGHHGSSTSSHSWFLDLVQPEYVAVSLGFRNRYNHPHREAVERIHRYAGKVGYTSLEGAVRYESDGNRIWRVY